LKLSSKNGFHTKLPISSCFSKYWLNHFNPLIVDKKHESQVNFRIGARDERHEIERRIGTIIHLTLKLETWGFIIHKCMWV
jgi:hypothetical protein